MELFDAIAGRRSVREYSPAAIDRETLLDVIHAAVQAPSAMNRQPWHFLVVRDRPLMDRLSHDAKAHMLSVLPASGDPDRFRSMLGDENFHIFYHAPALIVIAASDDGAWAVEDCTLAAQNLMLAAYARGLGSCWIGFSQGFLNTPAGKQMIGLPANSMAVAPIILGHPRATAPPVPRRAATIQWLG